MSPMLFIVIGFGAGIFGGMFGIGGATIMIPAMVYLAGMTQHQAQGTTLAVLSVPVVILAAWRYWVAGNVKLDIAGFICLGFIFGALLGAQLVQNISDPILRKMFGVFLAIVALKMIFSK